MQGHPRWTGHSEDFWQNVAHWRRKQQTTPVFLLREPHKQDEKAERQDNGRWAPQVRERRKKVKSLSCIQLFATPPTVAYQLLLSMGFSRQEYWSGLPFPTPRDKFLLGDMQSRKWKINISKVLVENMTVWSFYIKYFSKMSWSLFNTWRWDNWIYISKWMKLKPTLLLLLFSC